MLNLGVSVYGTESNSNASPNTCYYILQIAFPQFVCCSQLVWSYAVAVMFDCVPVN